MQSGEEQARVEGGGRLALQLGKKGKLSSTLEEEEKSMAGQTSRGGKRVKKEPTKERTEDGFFERGED